MHNSILLKQRFQFSFQLLDLCRVLNGCTLGQIHLHNVDKVAAEPLSLGFAAKCIEVGPAKYGQGLIEASHLYGRAHLGGSRGAPARSASKGNALARAAGWYLIVPYRFDSFFPVSSSAMAFAS